MMTCGELPRHETRPLRVLSSSTPEKRGNRTSQVLVRHLSGNPTNRVLKHLMRFRVRRPGKLWPELNRAPYAKTAHPNDSGHPSWIR
jgi:hypothetical protein